MNRPMFFKRAKPAHYTELSYESMYLHVKLMLQLRDKGAITFDYGNNIRARALEYEEKNKHKLAESKVPPLGGGGGLSLASSPPTYARSFAKARVLSAGQH